MDGGRDHRLPLTPRKLRSSRGPGPSVKNIEVSKFSSFNSDSCCLSVRVGSYETRTPQSTSVDPFVGVVEGILQSVHQGIGDVKEGSVLEFPVGYRSPSFSM